MVHSSNSRAGGVELGGSWGWLISQLRPLGQLQASERFCLKNKTTAKVNVSKGTTSRTDLWLPQACVHMCTCSCTVCPHAHAPVQCSHIHMYLHTCAPTYISTHSGKDSVTQPPGPARDMMTSLPSLPGEHCPVTSWFEPLTSRTMRLPGCCCFKCPSCGHLFQ